MLKDNMPNELAKLLEEDFISQGLLRISKVSREDLSDDYELGLYKILYASKLFHTFYVEKTKVQCYANRNRSIGDIFRIMKYYYPEITFTKTKELLYSLCEKGIVITLFCSKICKRVYYVEVIYKNEEDQKYIVNLSDLDNIYENFESDFTIYSSYATDEFGSFLNEGNYYDDDLEYNINNKIAIKYYEQLAEV